MDTKKTPPEYEQFRSNDPFPDIAPALLNSADLTDYIRTVRIVEPFVEKNLKPASYEIPFAGTVYWWNADSGRLERKDIKSKDDVFTLESNSIAFVHLATDLFLPDYIAIRFNLRITHVHQGLLLGTGPLVDPGFCGRLLVPLHNLTANKYTLVHGNGFIWVEFTKLSPNERWKSKAAQKKTGKYIEFPQDKKFIEAKSYFDRANGGRSIISSIPGAMREAKEEAIGAAKSAKNAEQSAAKASKRTDWTMALGVLGVLVTLIFGGYTLIQLFQSTMDSKTRATEEVAKASVESLRKEVDALRAEVGKLRPEVPPIDITIRADPRLGAILAPAKPAAK
jgi:deoxycytidine triphosphate deaminase